MALLAFTALGIWLSCGSTLNTGRNAQASILLPQASINGPTGYPYDIDLVPSPPEPTTITVRQPASVRPQAKISKEPLLECRNIMDTVALLNKESYLMINRAKEELSSP